jgi:hypothetical protein
VELCELRRQGTFRKENVLSQFANRKHSKYEPVSRVETEEKA